MANCTFRPEKLFEGTYSDEIGQAKCKYCPAGFYQNTPESKNCISCPAGWYQSDEGRVYCDACDIGKYSDKEAAKSNRDCFDCGSRYVTIAEASSSRSQCQCDTRCENKIIDSEEKIIDTTCTYNKSDTWTAKTNATTSNASTSEDSECQDCPKGANCSNNNGRAIRHLKTEPNYWRSSDSSVIFHPCDKKHEACCPDNTCANITALGADPNQQCKKGYIGPLCRGCAPSYVRTTTAKCEYCEDHEIGGYWSAVTGMIVFFVILLAGFGLFFILVKPPKKSALDLAMDDDSLKKERRRRKSAQLSVDAQARFVSDQLMVGRVSAGMSRSGNGLIKSDVQLIIDRVKVVFSWMQIFASMTVTFGGVEWPEGIKGFSVGMGIVANLDVMSAIEVLGSCKFVRPFLEKFLLHMLLPVCIIGAILLARLPAWLMYRSKDHARCELQREKQMKIILTIILIMYPGECKSFVVVVDVSIQAFIF